MTPTQQAIQLKAFQKRMEEIICSKRQDYASETDVLSNFKLVARVSGLSEEQVMMVFLATKVVRLGELFKKGTTPKHEAIEDTLVDLSNYSALTEMIRSEKAIPTPPFAHRPDAYCDTYCASNDVCDRTHCSEHF